MNYKEAINYIESNSKNRHKKGLERIKIILDKLKNPQNNTKIIHIAGTNGKGSSCAFITNILIENGYKTGTYISPHLIKYNERFSINNIHISDKKFIYYTKKIKAICDNMVSTEFQYPNTFEILTAMAFCYFNDENVDFIVLEVGLGGRFDPTNIIENPIVSCITSIGIDHTNLLGNTIFDITMEKAGIIKKNCPVILYYQNDIVFNIIKNICIEKNCKLYYSSNEINIINTDIQKTTFSVKNKYVNYDYIELSMIGEHQIFNSIFVLNICKALKDKKIILEDKKIINGIKKTRWEGRLEIIEKNPLIILDGAHNIDGINMICKFIKMYLKNKNITLILSVLEDKKYEEMINNISSIKNIKNIIITEIDSERKLDSNIIEIYTKKHDNNIIKEKNINNAIHIAKKITDKNDIILCTGSLYMIGKIKDLIK